jgi:hypothetical protein
LPLLGARKQDRSWQLLSVHWRTHRALEQYQIAQTENPMHENSLFNQAGLYAEVLQDDQRALEIAREFLKRFPQSDRAAAA